MAGKIDWETDLRRARERARSESKPILLDFHNPN